ncbi:MAG: hypothetical protein KDI66_15485 [Xanthomonadales bacterium]|nr:hypothetical protein [Xanthomonadales bacterium]
MSFIVALDHESGDGVISGSVGNTGPAKLVGDPPHSASFLMVDAAKRPSPALRTCDSARDRAEESIREVFVQGVKMVVGCRLSVVGCRREYSGCGLQPSGLAKLRRHCEERRDEAIQPVADKALDDFRWIKSGVAMMLWEFKRTWNGVRP